MTDKKDIPADKVKKIDLHMHTTVSDGTDSPEEILKKVKEADLTIFSVTDHDAVKTGKILNRLVKKDDPIFIPGVEFSCKDEDGKYHILGYGYDPENTTLSQLVEKGHNLRIKKLIKRVELLKTQFGFSFSDEDVEKLVKNNNPGKPHIANLMVAYGFAKTKEHAIKDYINQIKLKSEYIDPKEAIESILEAGAIPILAHPCYGSGDELIIGETLDERVVKLIGYGLKGLEAYYSGFSEKLRDNVLTLADKYDLMVTAGSDYHGKNKLVKLGDTGLDRVEEYHSGLLRFLETVCDEKKIY